GRKTVCELERVSQIEAQPAERVARATRERAPRASQANGASRRSGERESLSGSPRGEAPRIRLVESGDPLAKRLHVFPDLGRVVHFGFVMRRVCGLFAGLPGVVFRDDVV